MFTQTRSTPQAARLDTTSGSPLLRLFNWLCEKDRAYREARHLETLTDEHLDDVGLARDPLGDLSRHG